MPNLVRVRHNGLDFNVGSAYAKANGLEVLDESPRFPDGTLRPATRADGRARKPKVSVAQAAEKKAAKTAESDNNPPSKEN